MDTVLSNRDLVRHLLATSTDATPLLQTSKSLRQLEPCASRLEQWAETGCPTNPTSEQQPCLDAIGGATSRFCVGTYSVTALDSDGFPLHSDGTAPSQVAERVTSVLKQGVRPNITTVLTISWHGTTITVQGHLLTIRRGRDRRRQCRPNRKHMEDCLTTMITRIGSLSLCPGIQLYIPRYIHIECRRYNRLTEQEFLLFTADRH